jgi:hypothetical protein
VSDDELASLHREVQELLSQGGVSSYAIRMQIDLEREMCRALDLDIFDADMMDRMLDELHCRAWADAATRPERLVAYDGDWGAME